ncbi:hypothetical protein EVAR_50397_1 [Eumeta japonica]|uniref:Uncharacterized protein n=1 Tax=Eumeta variegata TaxID=151549 RepID=A0A4C1WVL8_EUMVA|nr:hypothetical protein EVAR_50397_1 [Eumeta japonica]
MCIRTILTFASLVFAYAAPKALDRPQVIQNKFYRDITDGHWREFLVGFSPTLPACTGARNSLVVDGTSGLNASSEDETGIISQPLRCLSFHCRVQERRLKVRCRSQRLICVVMSVEHWLSQNEPQPS